MKTAIIISLLWSAHLTYLWLFFNDVPGKPRGVKRWMLYRSKFKAKRTLKLCHMHIRATKPKKQLVLLSGRDCDYCKKDLLSTFHNGKKK